MSQNCDTDPSLNLVEIETMSNKNHLLRVYLSHCLSPILGDHLYGNRVQEILGKRLAIAPIQADNLSTFQKIPSETLKLLNLSDSSVVPHCLHLHQLTLGQFNKKSHLILRAEPPPHFEFACQSLNVNFIPDQPVT